jgi:hypothetical protein
MIKHAYRTMKSSFQNRNDGMLNGFDDPHSTMMKAYREVPDWWYFVVLLAALVFGIIGFKAYPLQVPVWVLFVTIAICIFFLIPMVILNSMANISFAMNVFFQLLSGWW